MEDGLIIFANISYLFFFFPLSLYSEHYNPLHGNIVSHSINILLTLGQWREGTEFNIRFHTELLLGP
jgi:hypothetical protein